MRDAPDGLEWEERKEGEFDLGRFRDPSELGLLLAKLTVPAVPLSLAVHEVLKPVPSGSGTAFAGLLVDWFGLALFGGLSLLSFVIILDGYVESVSAPDDWRVDRRYSDRRQSPWLREYWQLLWWGLTATPVVLSLLSPAGSVIANEGYVLTAVLGMAHIVLDFLGAVFGVSGDAFGQLLTALGVVLA